MRTQTIAAVIDPATLWAERKQDLMLVAAFATWAAILGLLPVLVLRALAVS